MTLSALSSNGQTARFHFDRAMRFLGGAAHLNQDFAH
jgi:hypothetical protein